MSWWRVDSDTLAGSRFVISPLAETLAGLKTLHHGRAAHLGEHQWLAAHLSRYRDRLAGDPVTAILVRAALRRRWNATFLTPAPAGDGGRTFPEELEQVRSAPPAAVRADLEESLNGPLPELLRRDDLAQRAAGLLEWVWSETVEPSWPRRLGIMEADIVARTARLGRHGWAAALNEMRPDMRWLGGDRLRTTVCDGPPLELFRGRLMFVPVTLSQSWLCWDVPSADDRCSRSVRRYAVVYPCSGVLAGDGLRAAGLVGDRRALVATPPRDHGGRYRRPYRPARAARLGRRSERDAPGHALARGRPSVCDGPPLELFRGRLMFVPVTLSQSWLCWDVPSADDRCSRSVRRYAVVYPCSGVLAGDGLRAAPRALAALLGTARAELLTLLDTPKSTTQLVALTGLPLGSVGRHLRILREARLAQRRRAGRSVLYFRTAAGQGLVAAQSSECGGL